MADYTKDNIKVNYVNQVFEDGDTLTAEHMTKINAGILEAASAEEVADVLTRISDEVESVSLTKANLKQDISKAGNFWKVGEDGGLTFEAGVPVDATLTKAGEAADAETVGKALNKKADSIKIEEQTIKLVSTESGKQTVLSSIDLPANVKGLVLNQDEKLYISDINNN
jgi:predicted metalloendopeptidase